MPRLLALAAVAVAVTREPAAAQGNVLSQPGSVAQTIRGTRIEIVYRRPVARGRTLFGGIVPWGRVWTPSADSAVRIRVSAPVEVNGAPLPAGEYSLWTIPDPSSWTVIFNDQAAAFHMRYPEGHDVLRVQARPRSGDHMETLAFYFPVVDADSAILALHWGTTIVPLTIRVKPN